MDSQVAAEHFLCMCFTDSVLRIRDNGNLTQEVNVSMDGGVLMIRDIMKVID